MKHFPIQAQPIPRHSAGKRGFALIITISLMAFLVLLLVTVGTFTRIETEVSSFSQKQSIAQEHAKMALEIAIGELQRHAGRDDRVTFRAEALEEGVMPEQTSRFWTGVVDTDNPQTPLSWLVSGNEFFDAGNPMISPQTQPNEFLSGNAAGPLGSAVRLVGVGSAPSEQNVYVPRIPIRVDRYPGLGPASPALAGGLNQLPTGGIVIGHYGYVTLDEGVKANFSLAGERYPLEELDLRVLEENNPNAGMVARENYERDLNNWNLVFEPFHMEDDFIRTMSPTRFGFEFLNDALNPTLRDEFFPGFDPIGPNPNIRHFNARLAGWQRVVNRAQATEGFMINPEFGDRSYGFSRRSSPTGTPELEQLFHDTTAYSRGVQTVSYVQGSQNYGLKEDLTRLAGDWGQWNNEWAGWLQGRARTLMDPTVSSAPDSDRPKYPLGVVWHNEFKPMAGPVVTHVHINGVVSGQYGGSVNLGLQATVGLWNPYDVDLDFSGMAERIEIRFSRPSDSPVYLAFGAGLHWQQEAEEDTIEDWFGSWMTEYELGEAEWFALDRETRGDNNSIAFEIPTSNQRLRAGETLLYSSNGNTISGRGAMVNGLAAAAPWDLGPNNNTLVDTFTFDRGGALGGVVPAGDLQEVRPMFYFPRGQSVRVEVVVVGGNDDEPTVIFRDDINISNNAHRQLVQDTEPQISVRGPQINSWPTAAQWGAATVDPGDDDDGGVSGGGWSVYGQFTGGFNLPFAFGSDTRMLPGGLNAGLPNLRQNSYRSRGERQLYSKVIPNVLSWNSQNNGYPVVMFQGGDLPQSNFVTNEFDYPLQLEDLRFMSFYHILRDVQGGGPGENLQGIPSLAPATRNWNNWTSLSSVGQLRVRTERPPSSVFDTGFFSSALLTNNFQQDIPPFFLNPRMRLYSGEEGRYNQEVFDRLERSDEAAAHLMTEGSFNVNSTSVAAWAALLNSFAKHDLLVYNPFEDFVYRHNERYRNDPLGSYFSRFTSAPGAGYIGRVQDLNKPRSIWRNGLRELKPLNLDFPANPDFNDYQFWTDRFGTSGERYQYAATAMAEFIVQRIKEEFFNPSFNKPIGPFRSVGDFINSGILQEAIDSIQWDGGGGEDNGRGLNRYYTSQNGWRDIPRSSPSYLTQDDILATLGSVLTARSDTFLIRTYGDAFNPVTRQVEARAYLEAVVQRVPTPVNPDPTTRVEPMNPGTDPFGRRFEIVHFRWLNASDL